MRKVSEKIFNEMLAACEKEDVFAFLNAALLHYTMTGTSAPGELIELTDPDVDMKEKGRIMQKILIELQRKLKRNTKK